MQNIAVLIGRTRASHRESRSQPTTVNDVMCAVSRFALAIMSPGEPSTVRAWVFKPLKPNTTSRSTGLPSNIGNDPTSKDSIESIPSSLIVTRMRGFRIQCDDSEGYVDVSEDDVDDDDDAGSFIRRHDSRGHERRSGSGQRLDVDPGIRGVYMYRIDDDICRSMYRDSADRLERLASSSLALSGSQ